MDLDILSEIKVILSKPLYQSIIGHCHNKIQEVEKKAPACDNKAFGLMAGKKNGQSVIVKQCIPLRKNARFNDSYKDFMDKLMAEYAIPSETPFAQRGWVVDPEELQETINLCHDMQLTIVGSYHMHRVPWEHDALRDKPTELDTILAERSRMLMFIISMVNPKKPIIRAFYEGKVEHEVPIRLTD